MTMTNPLWGDDWDQVRSNWTLDPEIVFLNHGSFGATPRCVLDAQTELRRRLEREPVTFLYRRLPDMLDEARRRAGQFLNAHPDNLVFVPNATTGINTVVHCLDLNPGDEILTTDHAYPAVRNTLDYYCARNGVSLRVVHVPLPGREDLPDEMADAVLAGLTERTRLLVVDHIASPTGLIFPVQRIVDVCRERGVLSLIDAAHSPGQVAVDVDRLGADFWTGNFHKWVCTPKTGAVLCIDAEHHQKIRPLVTSLFHGWGLQWEFAWTGTYDPTAYLAIPAGLDFMQSLGWDRLRNHNHKLARYGREIVSAALRTPPPIADSSSLFAAMSLAALPESLGVNNTKEAHALMDKVHERFHVEAAFTAFNNRGFVRMSAQVYNCRQDYDRLAEALGTLVAEADES